MQTITILPELKNKVPDLRLYCIQADIVIRRTPERLWELITEKCAELSSGMKVEDISSIPAVRASRQAYRSTGKDPARYRLSAESLLRRAVKEKDLYSINNVVDLLNLVSISTGFSIGGYDADKIGGDAEFGIGVRNEPYVGIGRGELNIEGLPVFRDEKGAFGSPTSDSERTCVDQSTKHFLMIIIGFGANHLLPQAGELAEALLVRFADATNIEIRNLQ